MKMTIGLRNETAQRKPANTRMNWKGEKEKKKRKKMYLLYFSPHNESDRV